MRFVQPAGRGHVTRSHVNKPTFSPPFLHPPSPPTATNATPPPTEHMGEARGHGRVGVQGTPAIFLFSFFKTDFDSTHSNPQPPNTSRTQYGPAKASPRGTPTLPAHPSTLPSPFTTQTRRTRPPGRVLRVWGVPITFYHPDAKNTTPGSCSLRLECPSPFPSPSTPQTRRT